MALGSNVTLQIHAAAVPLLEGAREMAKAGAIPGGLRNNKEFASCDVVVAAGIAEELELLLYDPQTSGGLLVSLPEADAAIFQQRFPAAVEIGRVLDRQPKAIEIL
jgi:selenide,water dikinase